MAVSYNRLYKVLEEKNVTMVELRKAEELKSSLPSIEESEKELE